MGKFSIYSTCRSGMLMRRTVLWDVLNSSSVFYLTPYGLMIFLATRKDERVVAVLYNACMGWWQFFIVKMLLLESLWKCCYWNNTLHWKIGCYRGIRQIAVVHSLIFLGRLCCCCGIDSLSWMNSFHKEKCCKYFYGTVWFKLLKFFFFFLSFFMVRKLL